MNLSIDEFKKQMASAGYEIPQSMQFRVPDPKCLISEKSLIMNCIMMTGWIFLSMGKETVWQADMLWARCADT